MPNLDDAFRKCPFIAIIRGAETSSVIEIGNALLRSGIKIVEVPLNSPTPYESIALLKKYLGDKMIIGAGTVLTSEQVSRVAEVGGQICVSPNTDIGVIQSSIEAGLTPIPGYHSLTEAFTAINAGATWLKCFPVNSIGADGIKAHRDVISSDIQLIAVGGVSVQNASQYIQAGCNGIGLGGSLYKPGFSAIEVESRATAMVKSITLK